MALFLGMTVALVSEGVRGGGYQFGGISCAKTQSLLPNYAAGQLDAETAGRIQVHLDKCPKCGPFYKRMMKVAEEIARLDTAPHAACQCEDSVRYDLKPSL